MVYARCFAEVKGYGGSGNKLVMVLGTGDCSLYTWVFELLCYIMGIICFILAERYI